MPATRRTLLRAALPAAVVAVAGCSTNATESTTVDGGDSAADATTTAPSTTSSPSNSSGDGRTNATATEAGELDPKGGPNVVESVPEDADHVVAVEQVAFAPEELTVTAGDTVAFEHTDGPSHTVTAKEDSIPSDADYWASGGFESQAAAESGFDAYEGVITSGLTYVHTFETTGEHEYYCIPHSHLQMEGTIVVEE